MNATATTTLLGYAVERVDDTKSVAYRLTGPRGAEVLLVRHQDDPRFLYPVNVKSRSVRHLNELKGWTTFLDEDGAPRPWS